MPGYAFKSQLDAQGNNRRTIGGMIEAVNALG
jgi:hypothetical protein